MLLNKRTETFPIRDFMPTPLLIVGNCSTLADLLFAFEPQVRSAIRSFWHNVPPALARVKNAIASGWCKQPTKLFVQTLKNGVSKEQLDASVVNKEYPRPTPRQLKQLGEIGELIHATLNEPGYPDVLAINTGKQVVP